MAKRPPASQSSILRAVLSWLTVIALSLVFACIAAELVLRHSSIAANIATERFLFYESPQHFRDQHEEFGYTASSENREVAIYYDYHHAWIEYDASFSVNNAGLVQRKDIDPARSYIVVVGDSFTQGQGASPWFYELEKELPALPLANLGVLGTGVQHWEKAVDWFQEHVARVEMVVVIFITDDFLRPYWFAKSSPNETRFCYEYYEGRCSTIFTKLLDKSPLALAQDRHELSRRLGPDSGAESVRARLKTLLMKSRTGGLLINWIIKMWVPYHRPHLEANKRSLEVLLAHRKVVFALHLPEKTEAIERAWSTESLELRGFLSTTKLQYVDGMERCGLGASDYRKFDSHLNPVGYRNVQICVGALLKASADVQGWHP